MPQSALTCLNLGVLGNAQTRRVQSEFQSAWYSAPMSNACERNVLRSGLTNPDRTKTTPSCPNQDVSFKDKILSFWIKEILTFKISKALAYYQKLWEVQFVLSSFIWAGIATFLGLFFHLFRDSNLLLFAGFVPLIFRTHWRRNISVCLRMLVIMRIREFIINCLKVLQNSDTNDQTMICTLSRKKTMVLPAKRSFLASFVMLQMLGKIYWHFFKISLHVQFKSNEGKR